MFGLFTALTPALLDKILGISNLALVGLVVFGQFAASVVSQFVLQRIPWHHALPADCAGLIAGAALVIGGSRAARPPSSPLGTMIAGLAADAFGLRAAGIGFSAIVAGWR